MRFFISVLFLFLGSLVSFLATAETLPEVLDAKGLKAFSGKEVILRGYYEADGPFAKIGLTDGTKVSLFPSGDPRARRPPEEIDDYQGNEVEVFGKIFAAGTNPALSPRQSLPYVEAEKIRMFLQESKLYEPYSVMRRLETMELKLWEFKRQYRPDPGQKSGASAWSLARDYEFILSAFPSQLFSLSLFQNIRKPDLPAPKPLPGGLQQAYGPRNDPNHVTAFRIQCSEIPGGEGALAREPDQVSSLVEELGKVCFRADVEEQSKIRRAIASAWKEAELKPRDKVRKTLDIGPALQLEVEARVQGDPGLSVLLGRTGKESVELRRHYCELEPRSVRFP